MKFEVEKKSNKNKIIIGLLVLVIICTVLVIGNTFAKYRSTKTIHIASGLVNYTADKENPKINNVDISSTSNSIIVTVNATDDKGIKEYYYQIDSNAVITGTSNTYTFSNLEAGTSYTIKIYVTDIKDKKSGIYEKTITTKALTPEEVLAKLNQTSKGSKNTFTGISTSSDTGVYASVDDFGTSYYFRGNEDKLNNWVQFAGFYWRIIRINGNGSIRMIYQGTSANKTGTGTQIGTSLINHIYNDNAYLGYMMGIPLNGTGSDINTTSTHSTSYTRAHTNTYESDMKKILDSWYTTNLTSYSDKLDIEAGFCNDRVINNSVYENYSGNGAGVSETGYGPAGRLMSNSNFKTSQTPSLKCTNKDRDLFTMSTSSMGNKKLTYPIGLVTSDEVVYAGGFGSTENKTYYLYTGEHYWTMPPHDYSDHAAMFNIFNSGGLGICISLTSSSDRDGNVQFIGIPSSIGVRPVINLKASAITGGKGSASEPFTTLS